MLVKCGSVYLYKKIFNYNKERGFPGGSVVKNAPANAADAHSISELRRPGEGNGNPLQFSCL